MNEGRLFVKPTSRAAVSRHILCDIPNVWACNLRELESMLPVRWKRSHQKPIRRSELGPAARRNVADPWIYAIESEKLWCAWDAVHGRTYGAVEVLFPMKIEQIKEHFLLLFTKERLHNSDTASKRAARNPWRALRAVKLWKQQKLNDLPFLEIVGDTFGFDSRTNGFGRATARVIELHTTIFIVSNLFKYFLLLFPLLILLLWQTEVVTTLRWPHGMKTLYFTQSKFIQRIFHYYRKSLFHKWLVQSGPRDLVFPFDCGFFKVPVIFREFSEGTN